MEMSKLTEWSFRNKAAIILLVVMALGMGVVSYLRLPMEFLPAADQPQVMITTIGPGSDAKSMETQVTEPLENAVALIKGKTAMYSTSGDGYAQVSLTFDSKTDMKEAKAEVERVVSEVQLPAHVMKPFVIQYNTSMIPISWVTLTFDDTLSDQERELRLTEALNAFEQSEGAGQISVSGKMKPTISVAPQIGKLEQYGIPVQALLGVLQGRGASMALGERMIDGSTGNLNLYDQVSDLETLRSLPIAPGIKLGDVADITLNSNQDSVSRLNGKDAVLLTVSKAADANAVTVGNGIEETVAELNRKLEGIEATVMLSTADSVVTSVNSMLREVLLGALFATIVILLFMRNFKATLVTIVSIPLSLGITLYLLQLSGVSLNIITLGGVAVAVGRLVDDSIVVIENIYRRLQKEAFSIALITDATKEVASAITSSTLVTVAVFLPMGLLRGSLQAFLLPFALTVAYSLLASLLVALTVVPLLSAVLLRGTKEKEHGGLPKFAAFVRWNLKYKAVPLIIAFVLFAGSIGAYAIMPKGALDSSSAENVNVTLEYPGDTPRADVLEEGKRLEAYLTGTNEVDWVMMTSGNSAEMAQYGNISSPTLVTYLIDLKEQVDAEKFMAGVTGQQADYAGASITANAVDLLMGGGSSQIYVDIIGEDPAQLADASERLLAAIQPLDGVLKAESNVQEKKAVYSFHVNPELAKGQEVAMQLQSMLSPVPLGTIRLDGSDTPVMMQPLFEPSTFSELEQLSIATDAGIVPMSSVAKLVKTEEPTLYYHKDGETYVRVSAEVKPSELSVAGDAIAKAAAELETPAGVQLKVGGASEEQAGDFADLGITALISIGLVYLIMVLTFKTLRAPIAIMISLPLAAIGAVTGLLVSRITPDFTSMFGALMLIGIVVTNAIVLIDRVKQNEQTMTIREALVEAAATRMRPIVMTALATISAMLPLVFGSHESGSIVSQSLAIVVIGGLTAATLLTLIIVPCVYELLFFRQSAKQRRAQQTAIVQEAAADIER